jgi:hypothetical protein
MCMSRSGNDYVAPNIADTLKYIVDAKRRQMLCKQLARS